MSGAARHELRCMLVQMKAAGHTLTAIASAAGVRQPLVSLALGERLVVRTQSVKRLFEYLKAIKQGTPSPEGRGEIKRGLDGPLMDALARLSDGSPDGDARLIGLLNAIADIRDVGPG